MIDARRADQQMFSLSQQSLFWDRGGGRAVRPTIATRLIRCLDQLYPIGRRFELISSSRQCELLLRLARRRRSLNDPSSIVCETLDLVRFHHIRHSVESVLDIARRIWRTEQDDFTAIEILRSNCTRLLNARKVPRTNPDFMAAPKMWARRT